MKNIEKYWGEVAKEFCKFAVSHDLVDTENGGYTCIDKKDCYQCVLDTMEWLNQEYKEEIPEGTLVWVADELDSSGSIKKVNIRRYCEYGDGKHWCYGVDAPTQSFPWNYVELVKECIIC